MNNEIKKLGNGDFEVINDKNNGGYRGSDDYNHIMIYAPFLPIDTEHQEVELETYYE